MSGSLSFPSRVSLPCQGWDDLDSLRFHVHATARPWSATGVSLSHFLNPIPELLVPLRKRIRMTTSILMFLRWGSNSCQLGCPEGQ